MAEVTKYQQILSDLLKDLEKTTKLILSKSGVESNSDLFKSIKYVSIGNGINMEANYYYPYVSQGRRRGVKKVPIKALIEYIKQYNIIPRRGKTINQLAFAIQQSIFKSGIKAKNFDDKIMNAAGDITQTAVADELAVIVADDLVQMFDPIT